MTEQSHQRLLTEISRFVERLKLPGVQHLANVRSRHVQDFLYEAVVDHNRASQRPAAGTMSLRRTAVRALFREGVPSGWRPATRRSTLPCHPGSSSTHD